MILTASADKGTGDPIPMSCPVSRGRSLGFISGPCPLPLASADISSPLPKLLGWVIDSGLSLELKRN